VLILTW